MVDDEESVEAEVVVDEPAPELAPAVDEYLTGSMEIANLRDEHEMFDVLDNHDMQMILSGVQSAALRKWIYQLPGNKGTGLTVHAVQDITQRMNFTRKFQIGIEQSSLQVERIVEDAGNGPEAFWVATVFAIDRKSEQSYAGTAMEAVNMRRRDGTSTFDKHSRTKAIQKAQRNALASFIPEEIEQTVIAMFENDPSRVQRIQTEQEAKLVEMPAPLDDARAVELIARCEAVYDEIKEAREGQGKVLLPPGQFHAYMIQSHHSHERLEGMVAYLQERLAKMREETA